MAKSLQGGNYIKTKGAIRKNCWFRRGY